MTQKFLSASEVAIKLGLCRASIFNLAKKTDFPKQHKFGRSSRWDESEVDAWIKNSTARGAYGGVQR